MTTVDFVTYFCEEVLDIAWRRAQDVLSFDDALKVRDIGDEILALVKSALDGYLDKHDYTPHGFDRAVNAMPDYRIDDVISYIEDACQKKYWGNDEE